jgi:hypothetical protein
MDMPKPAIVTQKVRQACWAINVAVLDHLFTDAIAGLGKMNSLTAKTEHTACQSATTASSSAHGAQRSMVRAFIAWPRWWVRPEPHRCGRAARARCR